MIEIEIDHTVDRQRQNCRPSYRRQPQDRCIQHECVSRRYQNYDNRGDSRDRGRQNVRRNFSNDRYDNRDRSRTRDRNLMPRRSDSRRHDPSTNLSIRNRSNSRVTTNRDRIRCYRCREYDHFANESPLTQLQMIQMVMNQIEQHCN